MLEMITSGHLMPLINYNDMARARVMWYFTKHGVFGHREVARASF